MKKFFLSLLAVIIILIISGYFFLQNTKPDYEGKLQIAGLIDKVEIKYDTYGIPHIYAKNETDAYKALGYVHAQERLFQMEMIRRVSTGTLAEVLGPDLLNVDKLFRTLGMAQKSKMFAAQFQASSEKHKQATLAYVNGINSFINNGATPIEFTIMGIPKREFTVEDTYNAAGYVSFGFAEGFKVDPVLSQLVTKHGVKYLEDINIVSPKSSVRIQSHPKIDSSKLTSLAQVIKNIPTPLLIGSNSWVVGGNKSKSGRPVFENDTHIGYAQPSVWFEAHIEYPGFSHYGHYLAGIPFSLLGHNNFAAIGLTMFENDDVDFYAEKENENGQVWIQNKWQNLETRTEIIKIKDADPDTIIVRTSSHGPIVNDIFFKENENNVPISAWWSFLQHSSDLFSGLYQLNNITSLDDARRGASMIESPGLNVMYADTSNNIAWWACAKLPVRANHINTKLVIDGSNAENDILGYYDFTKNPQAENPPWGYVYSANNQPDTVDGVLYPGYYYPNDRAGRIVELIDGKDNWTAEKSKQMAADVITKEQVKIARLMAMLLENSSNSLKSEISNLLKNWNGDHQLNQIEPSIHYTFQSWLLYYIMSDKIGYENLTQLSTTSVFKSSYLTFFSNENSVWWDNVNTPEKETRNDIINKTLISTINTLEKNYKSSNPQDWKWGKIHTLTHNHPLGQVDALKKYFSVGPLPIMGGNEVINNQMFKLDTTGIFNVIAGPAVRTVIDLSNMNGAVSINPTGQSGHFLSKHYNDQAQMFVDVAFRPQLMDSMDVANDTKSTLMLEPSN